MVAAIIATTTLAVLHAGHIVYVQKVFPFTMGALLKDAVLWLVLFVSIFVTAWPFVVVANWVAGKFGLTGPVYFGLCGVIAAILLVTIMIAVTADGSPDETLFWPVLIFSVSGLAGGVTYSGMESPSETIE